MVVAASAANKCLADIDLMAEPAMTFTTYLKRWLSHDSYRNLDLLGSDYSVFLQMVILLLDNPRIQEMHQRDVAEQWLAAIGPDVFNQMVWLSLKGCR
jgi:hypothetical protein